MRSVDAVLYDVGWLASEVGTVPVRGGSLMQAPDRTSNAVTRIWEATSNADAKQSELVMGSRPPPYVITWRRRRRRRGAANHQTNLPHQGTCELHDVLMPRASSRSGFRDTARAS